MQSVSLENQIEAWSRELGFESCGFAKAQRLDTEAASVEKWLVEGCNAQMTYLERNRDKRYNPQLLSEGTKTVIAVLQNYFPREKKIGDEVAKYAYGADYHKIVKDKLHVLLKRIEGVVGEMPTARVFVDSAPTLDRAWAVRCGLGFIGKNTTLIVPKKGSFFFIGLMLVPIELKYNDKIVQSMCGTCTRCVDACPNKALTPYHIDANKCISYLTIEHKGQIDASLNNRIFGCDICQDVCPHNRFAVPTTETGFTPSREVVEMSKEGWDKLTEEKFKTCFKGTAFERAGYEGIMRNVRKNASEVERETENG